MTIEIHYSRTGNVAGHDDKVQLRVRNQTTEITY